MDNYERIAQVIRYVVENHQDQPDLAGLAHLAGLSPHHFHRLFSEWAGVTPKDFVQSLTLAHVKHLLREGESVLGTALDAGLSGPGRLHDLCVTLEAASPGEIKAGGRGLSIRYGFADSPFGECLLAETPRGICYLGFYDQRREAGEQAIREAWPAADYEREDQAAARLSARVFQRPDSGAQTPRLRAYVRGSAFQVKVWNALLRVPSGSLVTYGRLAAAIGQPQAARAVGSAVGSNPVSYLIPCHRVIRETGVIGEYAYGNVRKRAIVAWESAPAACAA